MTLLSGVVLGSQTKGHSVAKRGFTDDFEYGTKKKEAEIMNKYLNANKYSNLTYREEYCKSKNWSIKFGW